MVAELDRLRGSLDDAYDELLRLGAAHRALIEDRDRVYAERDKLREQRDRLRRQRRRLRQSLEEAAPD